MSTTCPGHTFVLCIRTPTAAVTDTVPALCKVQGEACAWLANGRRRRGGSDYNCRVAATEFFFLLWSIV